MPKQITADQQLNTSEIIDTIALSFDNDPQKLTEFYFKLYDIDDTSYIPSVLTTPFKHSRKTAFQGKSPRYIARQIYLLSESDSHKWRKLMSILASGTILFHYMYYRKNYKKIHAFLEKHEANMDLTLSFPILFTLDRIKEYIKLHLDNQKQIDDIFSVYVNKKIWQCIQKLKDTQENVELHNVFEHLNTKHRLNKKYKKKAEQLFKNGSEHIHQSFMYDKQLKILSVIAMGSVQYTLNSHKKVKSKRKEMLKDIIHTKRTMKRFYFL